MSSPPRQAERLFDRAGWLTLGGIGLLVGGATLGAFAVGEAAEPDAAQTMAFATLALSELALVFAIRSRREQAWRLPRNGGLIAGVLASAALVVAVVYVPAAHEPFRTVALDPVLAALVAVLAFAPFLVVELAKALAHLGTPGGSPPAPARPVAVREVLRR
jgi:magnesium-transporting ATPase (P-type)